MERPTLRQLEALDAIARAGSFRKAATLLGVTQVAVSDHIRQLELRLGGSLFDRNRGGKARLTLSGENALARARLILSDCDALITAFRQGRAEPSSSVGPLVDTAGAAASTPPVSPVSVETSPIMIGTHPSIFARFQDRLAAFEDAFPERPVSIDFSCYLVDQVALALADGQVDMAYFYALGEPRAFPSDYLWSERWSLFIAREHPLAGRDVIGRDDAMLMPLLTLAPGNRLRPLVDACLSAAGLGGLRIAAESDDYGLLTELARDGEGILPLFGPTAARIGATPGLRRLPYVDPIPAVEVRRAVHPRLADDPVVGALSDTLR
jgi:DNA-binding transcriptional LysR family regulator